MVDIISKKNEEDIEKWGLMDAMYNPKIGDIVYLSGNPEFDGTYKIVAISEVDNISLIQPQYYPKYFVKEFNGRMLKLVVELVSETTPSRVTKRGVWSFVWDFALR